MDRGGDPVKDKKQRKPRRVGVVAKPDPRRAGPVLKQVLRRLERAHVGYLLDHQAAETVGRHEEGVKRSDMAGKVDLVLVAGGDGTILSVARGLGRAQVPVAGINLGGLGFLTEFTSKEIDLLLDAILQGKHRVDRRMMLSVEVRRRDGSREKQLVLNDAVVNKSALARILEIELRVAEQVITTYRADGLILSTPTGSTAYGLSAGGPIVHPDLRAIVVIPICPHTLTNRPLVIPGDQVLEATVRHGDEGNHPFLLTLDGQVGLPLRRGDVVRVKRSRVSFSLVLPEGTEYFQVLRKKLKWGGR
jgi:NAD+ kinase